MSCTHTGQHQPGRLPYPEALPRRPGPCAAQGLRRAGLSPQAVHCVGHGFRVRGCPPSAESPRFLRADFARLVRFWDPLRRRRRPEASSPGAPRQAPAAASPSRRAFACWDGLLYRLSPRCDCLCVPGALQTQVLLRWTDVSAVTKRLACRPWSRKYVRTWPTCQRDQVDHLPPAALSPVPRVAVGSARGRRRPRATADAVGRLRERGSSCLSSSTGRAA